MLYPRLNVPQIPVPPTLDDQVRGLLNTYRVPAAKHPPIVAAAVAARRLRHRSPREFTAALRELRAACRAAGVDAELLARFVSAAGRM